MSKKQVKIRERSSIASKASIKKTTKRKPPKAKGQPVPEVPPVVRTDFANLSVVAPVESAPLGPERRRLNVWAPVEGLSTGVSSADGDDLEITVSAEMIQPGGSVWLRALVDGKVAKPSDVVFKSGNANFDGVRSFTFVEEGVGGGQHIVEIQMLTGTPATIRDRVLTVHSGSPFNGPSRLAVAAGTSGPAIKTTSPYSDIPELSTMITTDTPGILAITFSAEAWATSGRVMVRALVDGAQVGEVIFVEAGDSQRSGTRSFTFVDFSLAAGVHEVKLQARSGSGSGSIGDRTDVRGRCPSGVASGH